MNRTLAILDENRLRDVDSVKEFIHTRPSSDLLSLSEGLRDSLIGGDRTDVLKMVESPLDQANFLPSSSLRGASSCIHWDCRVPKVLRMAHYAALYCDKAIVPLDFFWPGLAKNSDFSGRIGLGGSLCALVALRPLIEAGLVVVVREELHFCKTHWHEAVPDFDRIMKTADKLASLNANKFKVYYENHEIGNTHSTHLTFKGPEEYLEHGSRTTLLDSIPNWLPKELTQKPHRIPPNTVRSRNLINNVFKSMANDALLQTYFGKAFNARYVTDLPGEAQFFKLLDSRDALALRTATLCAHLTHSIPLLQDVPLETVLKVRREEPEAFANYRAALTSIVKDHVANGGHVGKSQAEEIYEDMLKPKLLALQTQAKNFRRGSLKKGLLKAAASSALVAIGIYAGVLPSDLSKLVTTIGGFNGARDLAEAFGAVGVNPEEVRNHNLYFLLRLGQHTEGGRRHR